jgi:hypothetical protein
MLAKTVERYRHDLDGHTVRVWHVTPSDHKCEYLSIIVIRPAGVGEPRWRGERIKYRLGDVVHVPAPLRPVPRQPHGNRRNVRTPR